MKSYTDLEQSKKLAEILPIESADMWFHPYPNDEYWYDVPNIGNADLKYNQLPCWSLAALLEIIPQEIFDGEYIINITEGIDNRWVVTYDHRENRKHSYYGLSTGADNLIDACYKLILKLNKLKML